MANNNLEKYLEAILAKLNGDNPPDVPTPSWNIEKYLAAILGAMDSVGGTMVVTAAYDETVDNQVLDKTWQEINDAVRAGTLVFVKDTASELVTQNVVSGVGQEPNYYYVGIGLEGTSTYAEYSSISASGYPALS